MLNTIYRLVAPRRIEMTFSELDLRGEEVIVKPDYLSICHADQRYYQGTRPAEILAQKLPMALIHEGVGHVVFDPKGEFKHGDKVVMIPNMPTQEDAIIAENYRLSSRFRASSFDGFMQEHVSLNRDRLVRLPEGVDGTIASFTELVSVSVHALNRLDQIAHQRRDCVGIWGDGNLGFITAAFFKVMFPAVKLYIFGVTEEKLERFSFADATFNVREIPKNLKLDHAIECVGGQASQIAIEQIIDHIQPEGCISLLGVSEYPVPINTRMVLERGLKVFGSSRSGREDFQKTVDLYHEHPELIGYLSHLVGAEVNISSIHDMTVAFEQDQQKDMGKTIMVWNV